MAGAGQSDLQIFGSKSTEFTRIQHLQEQGQRLHNEALAVRTQAEKVIERSQVQKQEGPQGGQVDRDGRRRQGQAKQGKENKEDEGRQQARQMGYGNRLDLSV